MRLPVAVAACLALSAPVAAQEAGSSPLGAMYECTSIPEDASRLACFDAAVSSLREREAAGDVAIVDRDQVRQTQREAFGFPVPSLGSLLPRFGGDGEREDGDGDLESIEALVVDISRNPYGQLIVELENGQVWQQIDPGRVNVHGRGERRVEVRRATLGSYMMVIDGRGFRVRRVE